MRLSFCHRYTPDEEPDYNGRHQWLFQVGPLRFGFGWITPVRTPVDWFVWNRAPAKGATVWFRRFGFGWRWKH